MYNAEKQSKKTAEFLLNKLKILCEVSGFNIGHDSVVKHNCAIMPASNNAGIKIWIRYTKKITHKKFFGLYKTYSYEKMFNQIAFVSFDYSPISRKITSVVIDDYNIDIIRLPKFELEKYKLLKAAIYRYWN